MRYFLNPSLSFLFLALSTVATRADLELAPVFSDHMVLQQGMSVPIWGSAAPGETVTVAFFGKTASSVAGLDGKWSVRLGPFTASSQPEIMKVSSDKGATAEVQDVLVGEVWVGSGQSNMQIWTSSFIGHPNDPHISTVPDLNLEALVNAAPYPNVRLFATAANNKALTAAEMHWTPATADALTHFSAQLSAMGVTLHQKLNVPVGLMLAAIGGSPSSRWITPGAITADAGCQAALVKTNATFSMEKEQAKYQEALAKYNTDHAAWAQLPDDQKKTQKEPGKPNPPVKPGEGLRWAVGDLHDQILTPIIGYGIRGILWDQGESGAMIKGIDQNTLMTALFKSWRQEWGQGDFPFVLVQKPSGGGCAFDYSDKVFSWASDKFQPLPPTATGHGEGREQDIKRADNPNTFLVPVSDLGSGLHPVNKFAYGVRDSQVILGAIYKQPGEWNGPRFANSTVEGDKIRVHFTHVGQGLIFKNGDKLQGFALAGEDKKFVWAEALIDGETVVVSSTSVPKPAYVRYAWDNIITWANLFNKDGFPALTFRTDP